MLDKIIDSLDLRQDAVVSLQRSLVAIPAIGPENGGELGEMEKANFLLGYLRELGFSEIREFSAPDARVACGARPNLVATIPGEDVSRTFWVISHIDVVPPGDPGLWSGDPFQLRVKDDTLFGRGVEDNHQGIVSSLILAGEILKAKATPPINYGVMLVSDEETGSKFGLEYLLRTHPDLFGPNDLFLIPDFGRLDSTLIEVAEKSMFWVKVTVVGKQCHASSPEEGVNSLRAAAGLILLLGDLYQRFDASDPIFTPSHSTFEPTKKEANVENVNTIPGRDVFYIDCRVLPDYDLEDVFDVLRELGQVVARRFGVDVEFEPVQREQAAPATSPESEIVKRLIKAVSAEYACQPKAMGVGGGTVAAYLRRAGHPCAVWASCVNNAHQPNERSSISKTLGDAKVMARVLFDQA